MKRTTILLLSFLLTSLVQNVFSQDSTFITGQTITTDLIWTKTNSPYVVSGDVMIKNGATLTIEPGVTVFIRPNHDDNPLAMGDFYSDLVTIGTEYSNGSIIAIGTELEPIIVKSIPDRSNRRDWVGFYVTGPISQFEYTEISNAIRGIDAVAYSPDDTLKVQHCQFSNIDNDGVRWSSNAIIKNNLFQYSLYGITMHHWSKGIVSNNTFKFNEYGITCYHQSSVSFTENEIFSNSIGIQIADDVNYQASLTFKNNNIYDNTNYEVFNANNLDIDFQENYWGSSLTAIINAGSNPKNLSKLYDRLDNSILGFINYSHWLDAPWPAGNPTGSGYTADLMPTDSNYSIERLNIDIGSPIHVQISDDGLNSNPTTLESIVVQVESEKETQKEDLVLTETGVNTGVFRGSMAVESGTAPSPDGKLQAEVGQWIYIGFQDAQNDFGTSENISRSILYGGKISPEQTINTPITFYKTQGPYIVTGEHYIDGGSLTIEPGTKVYVRGVRFINMSGGTFFAIGTEQDSIHIIFLGGADSYSGILFANAAFMDYCHFENCGWFNMPNDGMKITNSYLKNFIGGLHISGNCLVENNIFDNVELYCSGEKTPIINNNIFKNHPGYALNTSSGSRAIVTNNTFVDCQTGININQNANPTIQFNTISNNETGIEISHSSITHEIKINYNNIYDNTITNIQNGSTATDARFNYWGTDMLTQINAGDNPLNLDKLYDRFDDQNLGYVNYSHWLDGPWPGSNPSTGGNTGILEMRKIDDSDGNEYELGEKLKLVVNDPDLNLLPDDIDTCTINVWSELERDPEIFRALETGDSTGLFSIIIDFESTTGLPVNNGILEVDYNNWIWASYMDSLDDWNNTAAILDSAFYNRQIAEYQSDTNTILLLHLNEGIGQTANDASSFSNNGQLGSSSGSDSNDPTWSPDGVAGTCLYFPGEDYGISSFLKILASSSMENINQEITIEMWVKFPTSRPNDWFLGKGNQQGSRDWGLFYSFGQRFNGLLQINGSETGEGDEMWSNSYISLNEWKHIALTYNGSFIKFYVDSKLVGTKSVVGNLTSSNTSDLYLGSNWEETENAEIYIDEVRISDIARNYFNYHLNTEPAGISDLHLMDSGYTSIRLQWHAPGDDRYTGTCEIYDFRMSTSPIDSANFSDADSITGLPVPLIAGSLQAFTVEGLNSGTTYYFALKARDDEGNWSSISNIATGETPARYFPDDRDDQQYKLQQIGYQTWMAENLNYYTPEGSWYYDNDSLSHANSLGRHYNWAAAMALDPSFNLTLLDASDPVQGACPTGWHIPSDVDWQILEKELGMDSAQIILNGYRGTNEGNKLKYDSISGFDAVPAGYREENSNFSQKDTNYYFWSSTETHPDHSMYRHLDTSRADVYRDTRTKTVGMSVRCLKDIPPITLQLNASDVSKVNGSDGSIDASVSGGIPPFTYKWSNGSTKEDLDALLPGNYVLTVMDARDSTRTDSVTIFELFTDPRDNQVYRVVRIDDRIWMAENLNYYNGSGSFYYDNDSLANHQNGKLYTWQSSMDACPTSWYLPYDEEWIDLELALGMSPAEATATDWRGTDEGDKLKESGGAGFEAIMAGIHDGNNFLGVNNLSHFWTGTENGSDAWYRKIDNIHTTIERTWAGNENAYSVRCILDTCALIDLEFEIKNISCFGIDDGFANLTASGGKGPYTYSWSNGSDSNYVSNLSRGSYSITVSDAVGCSKTDSIIIIEPSLLTTEISDSTNISCNGFSDGKAWATTEGGTTPFNYRWDDISKTRDSTITGLSADRYYFCITTDANGCTGSDSVKLSQPESLDLGLDSLYQICQTQTLDITASAGFSEYNWSTGDTTVQITISEPGTYNLTVSDDNGCPGYANFEVFQDYIYQAEEICLVTVGTAGKNVIVWEKSEEKDISAYSLYREGIDFGTYDYLGTVPYESLSIFVDPDSDPRKKSYKYKLTAINSCGTESDYSFYHKSIHLQISLAIQGYNLNWVDYEYEAGGLQFIRYEIYRGTSLNDLQLIESVSSSENSYTDRDAPDGLLFYQIAGLLSTPCNPSGIKKSTEETYDFSYSNFEDNGQGTGLNSNLENKLIIYPNPASQEVRIDFPNPDNKEYTINLFDLNGRKIRSPGAIKGGQAIIDCRNTPAGIYLIEVKGERIFREILVIE